MTDNQSAFDKFTLGHVAAGVLLGLGRVEFPALIVMSIAFEIIETPLKNILPASFPVSSPDSFANATVDVLAVLAGWWLIRQVK